MLKWFSNISCRHMFSNINRNLSQYFLLTQIYVLYSCITLELVYYSGRFRPPFYNNSCQDIFLHMVTDPLVGTDKSSNSTGFVFLASKTFSWCKKSLLWSFGNNHLFLSYLCSKHYSVTNRDIWTTFCWLPDISSGIWVGGLGSSYTRTW